MMNGQVLVNDHPLRNKLYRFIEKKIHQWVESRMTPQKPMPNEEDVAFTVAFTEDDAQVSCVTEIELGGCKWKGCELASDTQSAFIHSLKRLHVH